MSCPSRPCLITRHEWETQPHQVARRSLAQRPLEGTHYSIMKHLLQMAESALLVTQVRASQDIHQGASPSPSCVTRCFLCHSCSCDHIGGYTSSPIWPNSLQRDRFKQEDLKSLPGASTDQFWTRACRCHQISWILCELQGCINKDRG